MLYLKAKGISLENGIQDPHAMRFGSTELPRFLANSGGYVETDDFGVQVLLNFRSGQERFRTLSLNDIKTENFNPSWIRDRIRPLRKINNLCFNNINCVFYKIV